jgi:hypothetical protein
VCLDCAGSQTRCSFGVASGVYTMYRFSFGSIQQGTEHVTRRFIGVQLPLQTSATSVCMHSAACNSAFLNSVDKRTESAMTTACYPLLQYLISIR